jgi:hypothetical protein
MKAIDPYSCLVNGKLVRIAPGFFKNIETETYSVNQAELGEFCHSHPDHCRVTGAVVHNGEVR